MATYSYDINGRSGKRWHIIIKVEKVIGIKPGVSITSNDKIHLRFPTDLTIQQETDLDALMTDPTLFEPRLTGFVEDPGQVVTIEDVFMSMERFNNWIASLGISGLEAMQFAVESDPIGNPGVYDIIELHFNRAISVQEKKDIIDGYKALVNWKA